MLFPKKNWQAFAAQLKLNLPLIKLNLPLMTINALHNGYWMYEISKYLF